MIIFITILLTTLFAIVSISPIIVASADDDMLAILPE